MANDAMRKWAGREKKKFLDSEKYKEVKKKETARVKNYRLIKKLTDQLQHNISTTATE